ncbi:hypothetical protein [Kitasatospora sp. NPDC057015]|uniref:hypothetical protein n=1 Tax=Kitasatospora sp. NPDC057015 TaxID=3346001 RepID=UPI00362D7007
MGKTSPLRLASATAATALALACLVSCTATGAGPTSTTTSAATAASTAPAAALDATATTASALDIELIMRDRAKSGGHTASEELKLIRHTLGTRWFLWPTTAGETCWGRYHDAYGSSEIGCAKPEDLPTGTAPALGALVSAIVTEHEWVLVLLADREEIGALRCGDVPLGLEKVAELPLAEGLRTFYLVTSPWSMQGTLHADVTRADGPAAALLTLPGDARAWDNGVFTNWQCA